MTSPDLRNLRNCIADSDRACRDTDRGPRDPRTYDPLMERLVGAGIDLPRRVQTRAYLPLVKRLRRLGATEFDRVLGDDPNCEGRAGQLLDISQAILQNAEGYKALATDAFQELVSDLYDGFLSNEDRKGAKAIDHEVVAPLVKWGHPDDGPYVWPARFNKAAWGVGVGIVNLPPALARRGLLGWAILGHETTGHDILHADDDLMPELRTKVYDALRQGEVSAKLSRYWSTRIDETASDVLGILNIGPAAGIGLIGHFRGWNKALGFDPVLASDGPVDDEHPAEILRGYLAAETVARLKFRGRREWATVLLDETEKDVREIWAAAITVSPEEAHGSAAIVAETIVNTPMTALRGLWLQDRSCLRRRTSRIRRMG